MKKILSGLLSLLILCTSTLSVSAEDITVSYDSTVDESSTILQNVGVTAEAAEVFAVTLPKSVTLTVTETGATQGYTVNVSGDIASNHYVRVIPLPDSKIKDADEVYAYDLQVTQGKKRWEHTELDGSVTADGTFTAVTYVDDVATPVLLEPGKYEGVVQFALSCDDAGFWSPANCTTPATCSGYDTNDNGVLDWGEDTNQNHTLDDGEDLDADGVLDTEYLATAVTRGSALGHKFPENCVDFPAMCERCKELVYGISTPEQYTAFVNAVNVEKKNLEGCTVTLCNDIDLTGIIYDSGIGTDGVYFDGTFDGNGYTISNLTIKDSVDDKLFGVFNSVGDYAIIKDVNFYAPVITTDESISDATNAYAGGLIGYVDMRRSSVHVQDIIINKGYMDIVVAKDAGCGATAFGGGLAGYIEYPGTSYLCAAFIRCAVYDFTVGVTNYGNACSSNYSYGGGLFGFFSCPDKSTYGYARVTNCVENAQVVVNSYDATVTDIATFKYTIGSGKPYVILKNCVATGSTFTTADISPAPVNCIATTNIATQEVLDILNTEYPDTWVLDLEGKTSGGYPVLK